MPRDQTLTVRLTPTEMAMLTALRHAFSWTSQANVVVFAMEDLLDRIAIGQGVGEPMDPSAIDLCASARELQRRANAPSWQDPRGRPSTPTARDRHYLSLIPPL